MHLAIREWQVMTGQNTFSNLLDSQADLGSIDKYYIAPGGNFFIAKDAYANTVGFIGLRNGGEGCGVMKRLATAPEHQRKGVGRAVVAATMSWAKAQGFTQLTLHTNIGENARPLYEQFGFTVEGFVPKSQDWFMVCNLEGKTT